MMAGEAGIHMTPKFHLMLHLAVNGARTGVNPYCHSTFLDEDFNGRLKALACKAHRLNWHKRVLANFRWAYTDASNKRQRLLAKKKTRAAERSRTKAAEQRRARATKQNTSKQPAATSRTKQSMSHRAEHQ